MIALSQSPAIGRFDVAAEPRSRCRHIVRAAPRRDVIIGCSSALGLMLPAAPAHAEDSAYANMEALKGKDYGKTPMKFSDYDSTPEGLQYKDLKVGTGVSPKDGDSCVLDWQGYTIGYYGRIFEARNKPKGSSFEGNDKDYLRIKLGDTKLIPGVQQALYGMKVGGVRRVIIPESLGYPDGDFKAWGPKPTTFAGKRTLDFVLNNKGFIDKTLLIDIELLKVVEA